ncbi:MAG: hypothetical protein QW374_04965 [Candidatus Bathyarchaeia archaeon]|nr:hypothetical protein [Candidatus Bathyarchaeota archaeon]
MAERVQVDILLRAVDEASGTLRDVADSVEDNVSRFDSLKNVVSKVWDNFNTLVNVGLTVYNFMQSLENANLRVEIAMNRVEDQQRRVANLQRELASLTETLTNAQARLAELENRRAELLNRLREVQELVNQKQIEYQQALEEVRWAQEFVKQAEEELRIAKKLHKDDTELIQEKEIQLMEARLTLQKATENLKLKTDELKNAQATLRDTEKEVDSVTKMLESTHKLISDTEEKRRSTEERLQAAQEDLRLAVERLQQVQNNVNDIYLKFALTTIPSVIGQVMSLSSSVAGAGGLISAFSSLGTLISTSIIPLLANPLTLAIMGIVAAVGFLFMAWRENWFGIRDILENVIDRIVSVIDGFVGWFRNVWSWLVDSVRGAFEWLWKVLTGGSIWTDMWRDIVDTAERGMREVDRIVSSGIGGIVYEFSGIPAGGGNIVTVTGPLVAVYGSVDEEKLARLVEEKLKTVLIEPTSRYAPTKRIVISRVM